MIENKESEVRLIDANALIRTACEKFYTTNYYNHILEMIDNAPTIEPKEKLYEHWVTHIVTEPKQEWISCKERLPSKQGEYLVTNRSGHISIETFTSCKREYYPYGYIDDWFDSSDSSWPELSLKRYENNIIAWMPLPKFNEEDEA